MIQPARLKLSALGFGVFWTLGMIWWSETRDTPALVMLVVAGTLAALFWYLAMAKWLRWQHSAGAARPPAA